MPKKNKVEEPKKEEPKVATEPPKKDQDQLRMKIKDLVKQEKKKIRNEKYYSQRKSEKTFCDVCLKEVDAFYFSQHCQTKAHLTVDRIRKENNI